MPQNPLAPKSSDAFKLPPWLVLVLIVGGLGVGYWKNNQAPKVDDPAAKADVQPDKPEEAVEAPPNNAVEQKNAASHTAAGSDHAKQDVPHQAHAKSNPHQSDETSYKIENQVIHDLHGKVVFQGTIDLKPTLDRIERGESNRHRNDGTSFQNREGRLPRKHAGYYKEYVHPTPEENGPGPQRIIIGEEGDIWYTPDHYKTFKEIRPAKA